MVHDFYGVSLNLTGKLSTRFFFRSVYSKVQTACGVLSSLIQFPRDIINILCTNLVFLVLTVSQGALFFFTSILRSEIEVVKKLFVTYSVVWLSNSVSKRYLFFLFVKLNSVHFSIGYVRASPIPPSISKPTSRGNRQNTRWC